MLTLLLLPTVLLGSAAAAQDSGTSYRFRVEAADRPRLRALLAGFDVLSPGGGTVDVIVLPDELPAFRALGLPHRLVARGRPFHEVVAERRGANPAAPPDANYFTVAEIEAELLRLQTAYPALARRVDVTALTSTAKTHEGRSIFALKISDNAGADEDEPQVLIASQHHARELNSPYMTIQAARRILSGYGSDAFLKRVVDTHELWLVPCVNPDGVAYVWSRDQWWRKNRRNNGGGVFGVDLNRNYPFRWGVCGASTDPRSQTYRGPSAGSEPETRTMMALARLRGFEKYLDFHSSGQEVLTTYSPCTVTRYASTALLAMITRFRDELARAMSFRTRHPSASGEAPEWHWAERGTMSFLVEVGRSFQPVFSETVAEELRVWPGVRTFLGWAPALRGHVRSLKAAAPLAATLDAAVLGHQFGELARSDAALGRLHLWLPPGATDVTVSAARHSTERARVTAPAYGTTSPLELSLIPALPAAVVSGPAQQPIGRPATLTFSAGDPGKAYWMPMSLGTSPGFRIGPRTLPLNADPLFVLSAGPLPPLYVGHIGTLDGVGSARATFTFPNVPAFVGFRLYFAGLTFESGWPLDVKAISNAHMLTLTR